MTDIHEAAAELALLTLATPPPSLRDNVLAAMRTTPPVRPVNEPFMGVPPGASNGSRPLGEPSRAVPSSGPRRAANPRPPRATANAKHPPDELALRRRNRVLNGLIAAMLAVVVGLGGVTYTLLQQREAQVTQIALEKQLYAAPDAVTTTTTLTGGGQVTFIASKQLNRALFLGTDLPNPGPNRYQLWTATGTDLENLTGVARDVQAADAHPGIKVFFTGDVASADFLAVNLEPAGSSPEAPTNPVLAAGPTTS
jgi:Anti-sigma-K factor rskA